LSSTLDPLTAVVEQVAQRTAELVIERLPAAPPSTEPDRWLDFNGALEYLGWGKKGKTRLYSLTSAEAIPFTKYGQRLFFDRSDLDAFIEKHRRGRA
jgi:hypothetical protein